MVLSNHLEKLSGDNAMLKVSLFGEGSGFGFQMAGIRFGTTKLVEDAAKRGAEIARGFFDTKGPGGSWKPIHEFTASQKGKSDILVDSEDLKNSIQARQIRPRTWVVVADSPIAPIQEFGAKIKVTDAMRNFLHSQGLHLRPGTESITIVPRRFMRPAADQLERELSTRTLQGKMGDWLVPIRGVERLV